MLIPFVKLFSDPLFGGRLLSVLLGLAMMFTMYKLLKELKLSWNMRMLGISMVAVVPYWFFHYRMALAEGLLTLLFSLALYFGLRLMHTGKIKYLVLFALSFGASLWTKTNALFFVPVFALLPLSIERKPEHQILKNLKVIYLDKKTLLLILGGMLAGLIFYSLRLTPLFPFLFTRSADYTFSIHDLEAGQWKYVLFTSFPRVVTWIVWYMTPFTLFAALCGKKRNLLPLFMTLAYIVPLVLLGRVLTARYFFPSAVLLTIMSVIGFDNLLKNGKKKMAQILIIGFLFSSAIFTWASVFKPGQTPFTPEDRKQYLMDWSSGHGIPQVRDFIRSESSKNPQKEIVVATEGYFGTLPDGLSIYFDGGNQRKNVKIIGIGEPIVEIPKNLIKESNSSDVYIVVNSDRFLEKDTFHYSLIAAYERPNNAPLLLLLKVK